MKLIVSQPHPLKQTVAAWVPADSKVYALFVELEEFETQENNENALSEDPSTEKGRTVRKQDLTDWLADLVLLGLALKREKEMTASLEIEEVDVAELLLEGPEITFMFSHESALFPVAFSWEEAVPLISLGVSFQITAGVAHEAENVPDDLSELES